MALDQSWSRSSDASGGVGMLNCSADISGIALAASGISNSGAWFVNAVLAARANAWSGRSHEL
jgi:hypothetical protein